MTTRKEAPEESAGFELKLEGFVALHRLSPREAEVLGLLLRGVHPKAMGSGLGCRYSSVRTHLARMCRKAGCSGALDLVLKFFSST